MGGIPGVPPATDVILGAGVVGQNAISAALGLGAHDMVLDNNIDKLREVEKLFDKRVELRSQVFIILKKQFSLRMY